MSPQTSQSPPSDHAPGRRPASVQRFEDDLRRSGRSACRGPDRREGVSTTELLNGMRWMRLRRSGRAWPAGERRFRRLLAQGRDFCAIGFAEEGASVLDARLRLASSTQREGREFRAIGFADSAHARLRLASSPVVAQSAPSYVLDLFAFRVLEPLLPLSTCPAVRLCPRERRPGTGFDPSAEGRHVR